MPGAASPHALPRVPIKLAPSASSHAISRLEGLEILHVQAAISWEIAYSLLDACDRRTCNECTCTSPSYTRVFSSQETCLDGKGHMPDYSILPDTYTIIHRMHRSPRHLGTAPNAKGSLPRRERTHEIPGIVKCCRHSHGRDKVGNLYPVHWEGYRAEPISTRV